MKNSNIYVTRCLRLGVFFSIATLALAVSAGSNVSDSLFINQTYLTAINLHPNILTVGGLNVVVAVIDDGIWQHHPDLAFSMWSNKDEVAGNNRDDDGNGYIDDYYGWNFVDNNLDVAAKGSHGTAVASIIASARNETGLLGIAPASKIMSLVVCDSNGCDKQRIIDAIYYAVNKGANVINLSLGGAGYVGFSTDFNAPIQYAFDRNVVVVAAAGNGDPENLGQSGQNLDQVPLSPVCNDVAGNTVIGVGASNAAWSNYGRCVDVTAPGEHVTAAIVPQFSEGYSYAYIDGTSVAAPMVTGAVALLREKMPNLRAFEIIDRVTTLTQSDGKSLDIYSVLNDTLPSLKFTGLSPASLQAGGLIEVVGEHFTPSSQLQIIGSGITRPVSADAIVFHGAGAMSLTLPVDLPPGTYQLGYQDRDVRTPSFQILATLSNAQPEALAPSDSSPSQVEIKNILPQVGRYDPTKRNDKLMTRLQGHILLQTESHGEAWYLNPATGLRYYMSSGDAAYAMMRSFGLGITDDNLSKISAVNNEAAMLKASSVCSTNSTANRLRGRILLQVKQHGEAWYIHPTKCRRIYLKDGAAAYSIMRFLSLGISNSDLEKLPDGSL